MIKSFAAVLLEVAIKICYGGPVLEPDALAKTLTLPVHEGFVTVKIDGQEIDLFLDSGYPGLSVMDGDWYEQKYGKGACTRRHAGCYFCPKEHPCDFEREEWFPTSFGVGSSIKSIIRSGLLVLDGQEATSYPFRVSRVTRWRGSSEPHGFFELSRVPPSSNYFYWGPDQSVVDSLLNHNLIGHLSFTLRTNTTQTADEVSGQLTLGETLAGAAAVKLDLVQIFHAPLPHRSLNTAWVSSVKLFDRKGNLLTKERTFNEHPGSFLALLDTGNLVTSLPSLHSVEDIGKKVEIALKNGSYSEEIANLLRRDEKGVLFVKEEAFDYLPVLGLRFGDAPYSFLAKIPPEHYCVRYPETGELRPLVMYANASTREYPSILGTPFFRAYSVHVNYQDHSMALLENV